MAAIKYSGKNPSRYLEIFTSSGNKITPRRFGGIFASPIGIPSVGATISDLFDKKWKVIDQEISNLNTVNLNTDKEGVVYKLVVEQVEVGEDL